MDVALPPRPGATPRTKKRTAVGIAPPAVELGEDDLTLEDAGEAPTDPLRARPTDEDIPTITRPGVNIDDMMPTPLEIKMPAAPPPPQDVAAAMPSADQMAAELNAAHADRDPDAPYLALEEGKVLARKYRLVKPAGFGGMAQLWVAKNESTGAEVCVKVLVPDAHDHESIARFRREAHAAAKLSHRAIVTVYDLMELRIDGQAAKQNETPHALAIVMELLNGETLADVIMRKGKLDVDEAMDLLIPVCGALAHAHRAGIVHRDVKPDNIFLARDPDGMIIPKILDFGVSKLATTGDTEGLTGIGVMLGTPSYMSPEQARGEPTIDARSDVFSMGIAIYISLTGKNPFEDDSFHSIVQAILEREPPPIPGVRADLWMVIEKALEKDPEKRWADGGELQWALKKATGRKGLGESDNFPISTKMQATGAASTAARAKADSDASLAGVGTGSVPPPETNTGIVEAKRKKAVRMVFLIVGACMLIMGLALIRAALTAKEEKEAAKAPPKTTTATTAAAAPLPSPVDSPTEPPAPSPAPEKSAAAPTPSPPPVVDKPAPGPAPVRKDPAPVVKTASPPANVAPAPKPAPAPSPAATPAKKKDVAATPGF